MINVPATCPKCAKPFQHGELVSRLDNTYFHAQCERQSRKFALVTSVENNVPVFKDGCSALGARVQHPQSKEIGTVIGYRHSDGAPCVKADNWALGCKHWPDAVAEGSAPVSVAIETPTSAENTAWLQTYLGRQLRIPEFNHDAITLTETAYVLSGINRFGSRTERYYSVAEHSVRVADCVALLGGTPAEQWSAINHEGDEALLGFDPPSPLLKLLPDLKALKLQAHTSYCKRYGLPVEMPAIVKHADLVLLATEKRDLMRAQPARWIKLPDPLPGKIVPWPNAYARFIAKWRELAKAVGFEGEE